MEDGSRILGAEPEHAEGDFFFGEAIFGEVFCAHDGLAGEDVVGADFAADIAAHSGAEGGLVVEGGSLVIGDDDFGHFGGGHAGGFCLGADDALDGVDEVLAGFCFVAAEGELEADFVADDVAFGAAVDAADGDDGGISGTDLAADDGL